MGLFILYVFLQKIFIGGHYLSRYHSITNIHSTNLLMLGLFVILLRLTETVLNSSSSSETDPGPSAC